MVNCSEDGLELAAGDRLLRFPAIWLRDNCPCAQCLDPGSGQKLKDITDIPNGLVVSAAEDAGESVLVTYAPDRHQSTFTRSWLAAHARTAFAVTGGRHLQGCYADLDGLASTLAVLARGDEPHSPPRPPR